MLPSDNLGLLERLAVAAARQKREQCLSALDELLTAFGVADDVTALDEIRAMFATYDKPGMATLSAEIEAMRRGR